jgi:hypothetical protein
VFHSPHLTLVKLQLKSALKVPIKPRILDQVKKSPKPGYPSRGAIAFKQMERKKTTLGYSSLTKRIIWISLLITCRRVGIVRR